MLLQWFFSGEQDVVNASLAEQRATLYNASQLEERLINHNVTALTSKKAIDTDTTTATNEKPADFCAASPEDKNHANITAPSSAIEQVNDNTIAFSADEKSGDTSGLLAASAQSTPSSPDDTSRSSDPRACDDEGIHVKDDTEMFVFIEQECPSERNGTLRNEMSVSVCAPVGAASRAVQAGKRKAEEIFNERTLKRAVNRVAFAADAAMDEFSARINSATVGMDVPEMASRVVEPVVNIGNKIPSGRQTSKFVDSFTDAIHGMFKRKKRRAQPIDFEKMKDVHIMFADRMGAKALDQLVTQNICLRWQIARDRRNVKWQSQLHQNLVDFFLKYGQKIRAEYLMDADPRWDVHEWGGSHFLVLEITYKVEDDPFVDEAQVNIRTGFEFSDTFWCVSTGEVSHVSPVSDKKDLYEASDEENENWAENMGTDSGYDTGNPTVVVSMS